MGETSSDQLVRFLVMRAFRHGVAHAGDLIRVTDISMATATRAMGRTVEFYGDIVHRVKRALRPLPSAKAPIFAGEAALLDCLDKGRNTPIEIGLFAHELPVTYSAWTNIFPPKEGVLDILVKSIARQSLVNLVYQGMTRAERPSEKVVFPLALEKMNDQWRLLGQDIEKEKSPLRVYVLSRILDAKPSHRNKPKGFVRQAHYDSKIRLAVQINPHCTPLQKEILERELCIKNGTVEIASRSAFEFCRRFTDFPASPEAIWPPAVLKGSF
jgi:hypothetical protein